MVPIDIHPQIKKRLDKRQRAWRSFRDTLKVFIRVTLYAVGLTVAFYLVALALFLLAPSVGKADEATDSTASQPAWPDRAMRHQPDRPPNPTRSVDRSTHAQGLRANSAVQPNGQDNRAGIYTHRSFPNRGDGGRVNNSARRASAHAAPPKGRRRYSLRPHCS